MCCLVDLQPWGTHKHMAQCLAPTGTCHVSPPLLLLKLGLQATQCVPFIDTAHLIPQAHPSLCSTHKSAALHALQAVVQQAHQAAWGHQPHQDVARVQIRVDEVVQQHHLHGGAKGAVTPHTLMHVEPLAWEL